MKRSKLFSAEQIKAWDLATLNEEGIASVALMERAARGCTQHLLAAYKGRAFTVVCGTGNNGGDGLAVARQLLEAGECIDRVIIVGDPERGSHDFSLNLIRLRQHAVSIETNLVNDTVPVDVCVDALFGTGLKGTVEGSKREAIEWMNDRSNTLVCIDMPSGLQADGAIEEFRVIADADEVLTFQQWKASFFIDQPTQALKRSRRIHVIDIGLSKAFAERTIGLCYVCDQPTAAALLPPRHRFGHKGSFGAVMVSAGSREMMGAAVLCTRAALRSGCGLVFAHVPRSGAEVMLNAAPEAIVVCGSAVDTISSAAVAAKITARAIGPGTGKAASVAETLKTALNMRDLPLVIDADGLNVLASDASLMAELKQHTSTILTPHPGEFDRLFGDHPHENARIETAIIKAVELKCVIHLKGAYSITVSCQGEVFRNTTGSVAMAVGGSGDVLTGLMAGLLAQNMSPLNAALLASWVHGAAGERYEAATANRGMIAGDLVSYLPAVFAALKS